MSDKSDVYKKASSDFIWNWVYGPLLLFLFCVVMSALLGVVIGSERAYANKILEEMRPQLEQVEGSRVCLMQDGSLVVIGNVDCTLGHKGTAFIIKRDGNGKVIDLIPNTPKI